MFRLYCLLIGYAFGLIQTAYIYGRLKAIAAAAEKVANEKPARKRQRVKAVDHVYSASKLNAKKIEKPTMMPSERSLFGDLSEEEKEILSAPINISSNMPSMDMQLQQPKEVAEKEAAAEEDKSEGTDNLQTMNDIIQETNIQKVGIYPLLQQPPFPQPPLAAAIAYP